MKLPRIVMTSMLASIAALAAAQGVEPPKDDRSTDKSISAPSAKEFFKRLAGEWEGQIETNRDGGLSASIVSVSNRTEDEGLSLASCFEGFSFGQAIEGATVFKYNSLDNRVDNSWFDSDRSTTVRSTSRTGQDSSKMIFAGNATNAETKKSVKFEIVFTIDDNDIKSTDDDTYTAEYLVVGDDGAKTSVLKMDLARVTDGKLSSAATRFEDATLMGRVRNSTQQATVDPSK